MALLLSTLQILDPDQNLPATTSAVEANSPHVLKPPGPALIIIYELSAYFTSSSPSSSPSSSYLSLLTRAVDLASRLGSSLAVFDAHIDRIRMPVYRDPNPHLEHVQEIASLVGNYVDLIVDFEKADLEDYSGDAGDGGLYH